MPYKDIEKRRDRQKKWLAEKRKKLKIGIDNNSRIDEIVDPSNVEPEPILKSVGPTNPRIENVVPENANLKTIEGKEYVFIEGRWEPKIWSFETMLEKLGTNPNHFNQEWIENEKQRCREYWRRNCPHYITPFKCSFSRFFSFSPPY